MCLGVRGVMFLRIVGLVWATVGDGFLEAWYEPTFCDLEKAVFKIRECDTIL